MNHTLRHVSHPACMLRAAALGTLWFAAACSSAVESKSDTPAQPTPLPPTTGNVPSDSPTTGTPTTDETNPAAGAPLDPNLSNPSVDSEWCQALGVFRRNCQGCHASEPLSGAPMPLTSFDDLQAPAVSDENQTVAERVQARIHDTQRPMPPSGMPPAEVALLDAWLATGAGAGADATCAGLAPAPVNVEPEEFPWPDDCEEFYTFTTSGGTDPSDKYVVAAGAEEHPQFTFDAPWGDAEVQMLAYRPLTDNARVLHHWILYENSAGGIFGGAGGGKFLMGWAPGNQGTSTMPDNVGQYMPGGAGSLRLDVHYYNLGTTEPASDASGVEVCITRTLRPVTATVIGLTGDATAPVGRSDNATSCTATVTGGDVTFMNMQPHMHKLGVHAKLDLSRGGQTTALHDAPFSFDDQRIYDLENVTVKNGDVLTTTCSYENDTGRTVRFGQNSDDEMCFNFVTYYPMDAIRCGLAL